MKPESRYQIEERLGRGGMSIVYKALTPETGRVVALKVLSPRDEIFVDLVGEARLRELFLEEAKIMEACRNRHVAEIYEYRGEADPPYIVLEFFPHSLGSLVGDSTRIDITKTLDVDTVFRYLRQVLHGLEHLHRAGVIHRDIKPHNLMITADERIKIIDFGLCTVHGEARMAIPGMQVGSPFYTAPELERNPQEADERSDLFSAGATAYRLLTGRLFNNRDTAVVRPSTFNRGLGDGWDDFLLTSLQTEVKRRHRSAVHMRQHLEEVYEASRKGALSP